MAKIIAEIGGNHNGNATRCVNLVKAAAKCGVDGVKFQYIRDSLYSDGKQRHKLFPVDLSAMRDLSKSLGLELGYSVFRKADVDTLKPHCDFLKVSSYDLLRLDLIKKCARSGLPLVLSTGMATDQEMLDAVQAAKLNGCSDLCVLHCVSLYPVKPEECQLTNIVRLRYVMPSQFKGSYLYRTGWSDHSVSEAVIYRAVHCWKADMIELHFDDGKGEEAAHSWRPATLTRLIKNIKAGIAADGGNYRCITPPEMAERDYRADPVTGKRKGEQND